MRRDGQKALVVGLGSSGLAAARFLVGRGATVAATDSRPESSLAAAAEELRGLGVTLYLGGHPDQLFTQFDLVLPSPGVPWNLPQLELARKEGIQVAGELEIAADELAGPVIGVTGSNGKTTVTSLIGHVLETASFPVCVAGNIGRPVLDIVGDSTPERWNVLELSSFQLEAMTGFRCKVAVILNITPDHLDRHGDFASYAAAKARILAPQQSDDYAVLNAADPTVKALDTEAHGSVRWFNRLEASAPGAWVEDGWIVADGDRLASTNLPIRGPHNLENALAAALACRLAGVSESAIATGLKSFEPIEHRLEFVRSVRDVDYYNDSKATNVDAALKAVESFPAGLWLILGGRDKAGDFRVLREPLESRVCKVLLIGEAAATIGEQLGNEIPMERVETLEAAVGLASEEAKPDDTVLLAPACASFDQFDGYGHRGREFKRLVEQLPE